VTFKSKSGCRVSPLTTNRLLQLPKLPPSPEPSAPPPDRLLLLLASLPWLLLPLLLAAWWLQPPVFAAFTPSPFELNGPPLPFVPAPAMAMSSPRDGLRVRGVEITQGIQVFNEPERSECVPDPANPRHIFCNNSVPLVAGRPTMARVYLACAQPCVDTTVQLRLLKGGRPKARLLQEISAAELARLNGLALADLRRDLAASLNFEIFSPPEWLSGEVTFELTVTPHNGDLPSLLASPKFQPARRPAGGLSAAGLSGPSAR
jgi:hypothetical protein